MKSFHAHTHVMIPTVALIGPSSGKMTRQNVVHTLRAVGECGLLQLLGDRLQVAHVHEDVERQPVHHVEQDEAERLSMRKNAVCLTTGSMMIGNGTNRAATK